MSRRTTARVLAVGVVLSLSMVGGVGAHAAPTDPGTSDCLGTPTMPRRTTGLDVRTHAQNNCSGPSTLTLQRWRGFYWQSLNTVSIPAGSGRFNQWDCEGTGTYTYRSQHKDLDGRQRTSPQNRFSC